MTVQEFDKYIKTIARRKDDLWIGIGITDIEYRDRYQKLRVVFGYYEQQNVWYELLMDDVLYFSKYNEELPNLDGKMWPEKQINPFVNIYSESQLLTFLKQESGLTLFYERDISNIIRHIQLVAQNMILNIVSRGEPIINVVDDSRV